MDIEEVHIYRHLDAVVLEIFLLIDPVHDHNLAVGDGSYHLAVSLRYHPFRNPVEPENEESKGEQDDRDRD